MSYPTVCPIVSSGQCSHKYKCAVGTPSTTVYIHRIRASLSQSPEQLVKLLECLRAKEAEIQKMRSRPIGRMMVLWKRTARNPRSFSHFPEVFSKRLFKSAKTYVHCNVTYERARLSTGKWIFALAESNCRNKPVGYERRALSHGTQNWYVVHNGNMNKFTISHQWKYS